MDNPASLRRLVSPSSEGEQSCQQARREKNRPKQVALPFTSPENRVEPGHTKKRSKDEPGLELTRLCGHPILGWIPWRKEALMGRPSKYPPEFRAEAVELVRSSGRPIAEVARSLDLSDTTLGTWVKVDRERRERDADPDALTESEREKLKRIRRESVQLRVDNEILRRAAAYFARETMR